MFRTFLKFSSHIKDNGQFGYSTKEPGSSEIFIQFYTKYSTDVRQSFYHFVHIQKLYNMHKDSVCYTKTS